MLLLLCILIFKPRVIFNMSKRCSTSLLALIFKNCNLPLQRLLPLLILNLLLLHLTLQLFFLAPSLRALTIRGQEPLQLQLEFARYEGVQGRDWAKELYLAFHGTPAYRTFRECLHSHRPQQL